MTETMPIEFEGGLYPVTYETIRLAAKWNKLMLERAKQSSGNSTEYQETSQQLITAIENEVEASKQWKAAKGLRFLDELVKVANEIS